MSRLSQKNPFDVTLTVILSVFIYRIKPTALILTIVSVDHMKYYFTLCSTRYVIYSYIKYVSSLFSS